MKDKIEIEEFKDWLGEQMLKAFRHGRNYKHLENKYDSLPEKEENYPFWEWYKNIYLKKID